MARQARLTGTNPPELVLVVREAVLEAPVGTAAVRRGQLTHLKRLVDEGRSVLKVVRELLDVALPPAESVGLLDRV